MYGDNRVINEEWRENTIELTAKAIWIETQKACEPMCDKGLPCSCALACAEAAFNTLIQELPEGYTTPFISKSKRELKFYTQLLAMKD